MIYPSIDKLLNQVGSKYLLVNLVAKRAKEMKREKFYQMPDEKYVSASSIGKSLEEVTNGLMTLKSKDE